MALIGILATALIAAVSSVLCDKLGIPVWMMFIGWIGFIAGGPNLKAAPVTFACSLLGVALGMAGLFFIMSMPPSLGALGLLAGVFLVTVAALTMQFAPVLNNVLGFFIGMVTFFASALPISTASFIKIGAGLLIGILAGLLVGAVTARLGARSSGSHEIAA